MDVEEEIVPCYNHDMLSYTDKLSPGFRFCPQDSELILHYLKPKIESRHLPEFRLHEVNIYNHTPEELAEGFGSCNNKWYFLTPRDRIYAQGNRPKRATRNVGYWKATQKQKEVYDDVTGKVVGHKASLEFHDQNSKKTVWLMHEYTTTGTNLPLGTKKLNQWVLCKIYKREKNQSASGGPANEEPKKSGDGPFPAKRSKTHESEDQETNSRMVAPQEFQPTVENFHHTSHNSIAMQKVASFQDFNLIQPGGPYYQKRVRDDYQFTNGASRSLMEPVPLDYGGYTAVLAQTPVERNQVFQQNWYQDSETLLDVVQKNTNDQSMVMPNNAYDHHIPQSTANNGYQFQNGASSYLSSDQLTQPLDLGGYTAVLATTPANSNQFHVQNMYHDDSRTLLGVKSSLNQFMVVPDDQNATIPPPDPDPDNFSWNILDEISFDDFVDDTSTDVLKSTEFPTLLEIGQ